MNDKMYNILKWIAQLVLPAAGVLYFALASIWNLPYGEQVVGTITAVDAFLGAILGISTMNYNKNGKDGTLEIDTSDPSKDVYRLNINTLDGIKDKHSITLNVDSNAHLFSENATSQK